MTQPPIGIPHSSGLEITLEKDGNAWSICSTPLDTECDGETGHLALNGQVIGIPSKEPYYWTDFSLEAGFDTSELKGYRVGVRYYEQYSQTNGPPGSQDTTYYRAYPGFELIEQTFEQNGDIKFTTDTGDELFTADEGDYNTDEYAMAGIKSGTKYSYTRVFDQADISYIPRLSVPGQLPVGNGVLPSTPYDENADPPLYPIDLLTSFLPDDRDSVTVSYKLTTKWKADGNVNTTEVTISQTCTQSTDFSNIQGKIKSYQKASYYGNDLPHVGLYPPPGADFDAPEYDDNGELKSGKLNEPFDIRQLKRNSFPVEFETGKFRPCPEKK